jgi:YidC/Oxa1 family membrane protein insertase
LRTERRWLLFILISFVVIQLFSLLITREQKKAAEMSADLQTETTGTAALDPGTSATQVATATTTAPREVAPAPPVADAQRTLTDTTATLASHPGDITTATTSRYRIGFDNVGAVVHSWLITDPGSESLRKSEMSSGGLEMVRRIPSALADEAQIPPQTWPLEVSFKESNVRNFEDLNYINWQTTGFETKNGRVRGTFQSPTVRDIRVTKMIDLDADGYYGNLSITLHNESTNTVALFDDTNRGLIVRWGPGLFERDWTESVGFGADSYDGAVYRMGDKVKFASPSVGKDAIEADGPMDFAGVESKFFAALLVPEQPDNAAGRLAYSFRALVPSSHDPGIEGFKPPLTMELATGRVDLGPGASRTFNFGLYMGPKKFSILKDSHDGLQSLMFHNSWSFMRAVYLFLTDLLNWIYKFVANYGIAIIILTVLVRLVTFPLTQHSIKIQAKTMAEQARVKPYIEAINEKYKSDPQEKNRQVWKVYQEHGISPFGALRGCVPMLLQMPVFIGLYRVCNDTIDLQGATFLWMKDLSVADHLIPFGMTLPFLGGYFNILPVLMGLTQVVATKVSMTRVKTMDPTQKQMMYMMPVVLTVMLYHMPAGLMIYWNASNVWQIFQTILTNKQLAREEARHAAAGTAQHPVIIPAPTPAAEPKKKSSKKK